MATARETLRTGDSSPPDGTSPPGGTSPLGSSLPGLRSLRVEIIETVVGVCHRSLDPPVAALPARQCWPIIGQGVEGFQPGLQGLAQEGLHVRR